MSLLPIWTDHSSYVVEFDEPEWARFEFEGLYGTKQGDLYAEVLVASTAPGEEEVLIEGRLNLQAPQTVKTWSKDMAGRANGRGGLDWYGMFARACQEVKRAHRNGEPSVVLRDVDDSQDDDYMVSPLILDRNPTVLFGKGGNGKSLLALALGALINGAPINVAGLPPQRTTRVALLDWEFDPIQHKRRLRSICGNEGMPDLVYLRCATPLRSMIDRVKKVIAKEKVGYLLIDSAVGACGGDPNDAEVANAMYAAIRSIGLGALVIAHVTKDGNEEAPLGSIMNSNLARLTWLVKKEQDHGQQDFQITLTCKKTNMPGPWPLPMGLRMTTEDRRLRITRTDSSIATQPSREVGSNDRLGPRILDILDERNCTAAELAIELGSDDDTTRRALNRLALEKPPKIERVGVTHNRQTIWGRPQVPW